MSRWVGFLIAVILGVAAGLYYGWAIDPVEYVDTSPDSLLIDYQADYVLMVAEAYQVEENLDLAARRLVALGDAPLADLVQNAIVFGSRAGYVDADLAKMRSLQSLLKDYTLSSTQQVPMSTEAQPLP